MLALWSTNNCASMDLDALIRPRMRGYEMEFDSYVFSKQPGFDEPEMRKVFKQAVPLRTVVIYCYDPRAVNIPEAVARTLSGEV